MRQIKYLITILLDKNKNLNKCVQVQGILYIEICCISIKYDVKFCKHFEIFVDSPLIC